MIIVLSIDRHNVAFEHSKNILNLLIFLPVRQEIRERLFATFSLIVLALGVTKNAYSLLLNINYLTCI